LGYRRIEGVLSNLGHEVARSTIAQRCNPRLVHTPTVKKSVATITFQLPAQKLGMDCE
jgi:hypothetical protein